MRSRFLTPLAVACLVLVAVGCDGTISVTFATGPQELEVSTDGLLPPELRDDASGNIAMVECGPMGMCPPTETVTLTCEAGFCDPAPKTLSAPVGGVIDVDDLLAETRDVGLRVVDSYDVEEVSYDVQLNTLTVPTSEIEVFWGPEAATSIDESLGVRLFGTVPAIPAGQTRSGQVIIDPAGEAALSEYLVEGGSRIRFFARTVVDLDPGDPFPVGSVRVAVNVRVRAVGSVVD